MRRPSSFIPPATSLPVNLSAPLGERYGPAALAGALRAGEALATASRASIGRTNDCARGSTGSSRRVGGRARCATAPPGTRRPPTARSPGSRRSARAIARTRGCAHIGTEATSAFSVPTASPWAWKTGLGSALLTAALCDLAEHSASALIPAVRSERFIATYEERAAARVVDRYDYAHARGARSSSHRVTAGTRRAVMDRRCAMAGARSKRRRSSATSRVPTCGNAPPRGGHRGGSAGL